jgi:hypothetical protein
MATILMYYTRFLATVAAALALLWGFLAVASPVPLDWLLGSRILVLGPVLWFLYLALRLGNPRSAARFYATSLRPWGRARIILFGILSIGSLGLGGVVGLVLVMPGLASSIGAWGPISALAISMLYMIAAHFGSRSLAYSAGIVRYEGEPILEPGGTVDPKLLRLPYRG